MKDKISGIIGFENLSISCIIGIEPEERIQEQEILIDLKVEANFSTCIQSDRIKDTISYVELSEICTELAKRNAYQLMETYANDVLDALIKFDITWAWIKIKKPKALQNAVAFVELTRAQTFKSNNKDEKDKSDERAEET